VQCSERPVFKSKRCVKHSQHVSGAEAGLPQSEVIVAHRQRRVLAMEMVSELYDVCLVLREAVTEPSAPRRWVSACMVTPGQLQEYWDQKQESSYLPTKSPGIALQATACKTHKEAGGAARRTQRGGWLYACTPAGYILHLKEYVGCESLPQRYFFLAELVHAAPSIDLVIHDDACHLRKHCASRAKDGAMAAALAYPMIQYVTDRLHARGHIDPWCLATCSPTAACNVELVAGVNTSVCEQLFSKLGRHKFVMRVMDRLTGLEHHVSHVSSSCSVECAERMSALLQGKLSESVHWQAQRSRVGSVRRSSLAVVWEKQACRVHMPSALQSQPVILVRSILLE